MAKKVFVGMSGGVDSSVTAALLKEQGYDVTGVYMKNWTKDLPGMICPWKEDYLDAKRVAVQLKIDFKLYDFETEYRHLVVDYMIAEYKKGRTPNPDIMCNQEVKFKLFLQAALKDGADFIATGHYARTKNGQLLMAQDKNKDQTYFLYRVDKDALDHTLFPIGEHQKPEVRDIAQKLGLVTATKPDSQGICFVGKVGIKDFLLHELGKQPEGPIIDQNGKQVGLHDGAIFYTIGQRHGLQVGGGLPFYVTKKDIESNTLHVTTNLDDKNLWSTQLTLSDFHVIDTPIQNGTEYSVRLRHRGPLIPCTVEDEVLTLKDAQRGLAAGQSAVIYDNDVVLGGGIITDSK